MRHQAGVMKGKGSGLARKSPEPRAASSSEAQAAAAYATLVRRFAAQPRVTVPASKRGKFGSNALKIDGKIFAMLVKGALAVKLPVAEVEAASIAGQGEPLSMGRRVMKEWLLVNEPSQRWYAVAEQARAFVAGHGGEPRSRTATAGAPARGARRARPK